MAGKNSIGRTSLPRSPQERKESLRKIITRAQHLKETVNDTTILDLNVCMEETDYINAETTVNEKIHNQEEVLMDSEMMNISSKVLLHCTRSLTKKMRLYDYVEFAQKLVQHVQQIPDPESEVPDWSLLEKQATKCFKRTPYYSTLLGTLAPLEKKEVKVRKPIVKEVQAPIKRPEKIVTTDKEEEGTEQTDKMMKFIHRYCKTNRKPLDFFQLILHPTDFGKTIENILHISFLIRDGKVKISKAESGILFIQSCSKDMTVQAKAGKRGNIQNVLYLNMEQWKILNDTYRLEKPMIDFSTRS